MPTVTDWTPNEIAAARKLAGADADKMCVPPGAVQVWTPDGPKTMVSGEEMPLWMAFAPFVRDALKIPANPTPAKPAPAPAA